MNKDGQSSVKLSVWQIYYNQVTFKSLDSNFIPYSNQGKVTLFFESEVIINVWNEFQKKLMESDYVGVLSWRFREKTNMTYRDIFDHISNDKNKKDVYSMTPVIYDRVPSPYSVQGFGNVFLICKLMDKYELFPFKTAGHNSKNKFKNFCNFFVCKPEIFNDFVENYLNKLFIWLQTCNDPELLAQLRIMITHRGGQLYPIHAFVMEGLFECYVEYKGYSFDYIRIADPHYRDMKHKDERIFKKALNVL